MRYRSKWRSQRDGFSGWSLSQGDGWPGLRPNTNTFTTFLFRLCACVWRSSPFQPKSNNNPAFPIDHLIFLCICLVVVDELAIYSNTNLMYSFVSYCVCLSVYICTTTTVDLYLLTHTGYFHPQNKMNENDGGKRRFRLLFSYNERKRSK